MITCSHLPRQTKTTRVDAHSLPLSCYAPSLVQIQSAASLGLAEENEESFFLRQCRTHTRSPEESLPRHPSVRGGRILVPGLTPERRLVKIGHTGVSETNTGSVRVLVRSFDSALPLTTPQTCQVLLAPPFSLAALHGLSHSLLSPSSPLVPSVA